MQATPEFWTPQKLTEAEINKICSWLMAWQSACVTSDSIAQDFVEDGEQLPSQKLDPAFKTSMRYLESLIRHLGALRENAS